MATEPERAGLVLVPRGLVERTIAHAKAVIEDSRSSLEMLAQLRAQRERRDTFIATEVSLALWQRARTGEPLTERECDDLAQAVVAEAARRWDALAADAGRGAGEA